MFLKAERIGNFVLLSKQIFFIDRLKVLLQKRFVEGKLKLNGKKFVYTDSSSFMAIYTEVFQKQIYKYQSNKSKPVIYDCGANIGLSVIYFKIKFPNAELHAFEPDPMIFNILKSNLAPYNFSDLILHENAVWKSNEELSFLAQGGSSGKISKEESTFKVKGIRLKEWLNQEIDFLKMDIEGVEFEVLKDCKDELKMVRNLFIEYHAFENEEQYLDEILSIVKVAGFKYFIQHETSSNSPFIKINKIGNMNLQLNLFCYR